eukprot:COSAG05_NODE_11477_length_511_cov_5.308197_1_plen_53_part_01
MFHSDEADEADATRLCVSPAAAAAPPTDPPSPCDNALSTCTGASVYNRPYAHQ